MGDGDDEPDRAVLISSTRRDSYWMITVYGPWGKSGSARFQGEQEGQAKPALLRYTRSRKTGLYATSVVGRRLAVKLFQGSCLKNGPRRYN